MLTKNNIPLGYMNKRVEQRVRKGSVIPFTALKDCIGMKVLYEGQMYEPRRCYYKVVEITDYLVDNDKFYDCYWENGHYVSKPEFTCDRVVFKDKDRSRSHEICAISEGYCSNGRFEPVGVCPSCFYDFNVA